MINYDRVAEFLIDLIKYADDEDIKIFLENCSDRLKATGINDYKTTLLNYLFEYIYGFIEPKLPTLPPLVYEDSKLIRGLPMLKYPNFNTSVSYYTDLYLHLYALCECYYSYPIFNAGDKNIKTITKEFSKIFSTENKINYVTDKSIKNLFKLLINSYTKNKFYYYFYDNTLTKVVITKRVKNRRPFYYLQTTNYQLVDKDNTTYIINSDKGIKKKLKKKLVRNTSGEIDFKDENFATNIQQLLVNVNPENVKAIHSDIVSAITEQHLCKCCGSKIDIKNKKGLCENCKNLFKQLNSFCNGIDELEPNKIIFSFKNIKFEKLICKIGIKSKKITTIKNNRLARLNKEISRVEKEISKELKKGNNFDKYNILNNQITNIKVLIKECFEN